MNYEKIKACALEPGGRVDDLIALSRKNDPFYCGQPGQVLQARWFASLWELFRFPQGVHLRRIHYLLVSQDRPILDAGGTAYANTERCWKLLGEASKGARYLELVPLSAFTDRRNPEPFIYEPGAPGMFWPCAGTPPRLGGFELPEMPEIPEAFVSMPGESHHYHVEIWAEKSTINDVLLPLCKRHGVNLVTGVGEMSITAVHMLIERMTRKPARILYISDYDPGGQSMPVAVARKVEYILHKNGKQADNRLYPLALTAEQIHRYNLPRIPIKESESRKASFELRHGEGATELDALEALHPGELAGIVEAAITRYRDPTLRQRLTETETRARRELGELNHTVRERYASEIEEAEERWQSIDEAIGDWLDTYTPVWNRMHGDLSRAIGGLGWRYPEPALADEIPNPLFDSARDYFEQLGAYKRFQQKPTNHPDPEDL